MTLRTTSHAVYDTQYHLVWAPKYRKAIMHGALQEHLVYLLPEIAAAYDIILEEHQVSVDHVHLFCSLPPRLSIARVVGILKSLSARETFREFPHVKRQLWGGEFWEDGYFARTVGDKVTPEVIKNYIRHHRDDKVPSDQLNLFS